MQVWKIPSGSHWRPYPIRGDKSALENDGYCKGHLTGVRGQSYESYPQSKLDCDKTREYDQHFAVSSRQSVCPLSRSSQTFGKVARCWAHRAITKTWATSVDKTKKMRWIMAVLMQLRNFNRRHRDSEYLTHSCPMWSIKVQGNVLSAHTSSV